VRSLLIVVRGQRPSRASERPTVDAHPTYGNLSRILPFIK